MKVDESNEAILNKASKYTNTNYIKWFDAENIEGYIEQDDLIDIIDSLLYEIDMKDNDYRQLEIDIEENYIPRPMSDYTGDRYDDRF